MSFGTCQDLHVLLFGSLNHCPDLSSCFPTLSLFRHPFPKVFNQCNRRELEKYLQSGGGMCLSNMPDTKRMYGGGKCGNGYLEEGEECDCGEVEVTIVQVQPFGV